MSAPKLMLPTLLNLVIGVTTALLTSCVTTVPTTVHTPSSSTQATIPPKGHLTPKQAYSLMKNGQATVVDLRSQEMYNLGHIPGAILIPVSDLASRLDKLDPEQPILIYHVCQVCSWKATQILRENNFTHIYNLEGGLLEWEDQGFPVVQ